MAALPFAACRAWTDSAVPGDGAGLGLGHILRLCLRGSSLLGETRHQARGCRTPFWRFAVQWFWTLYDWRHILMEVNFRLWSVRRQATRKRRPNGFVQAEQTGPRHHHSRSVNHSKCSQQAIHDTGGKLSAARYFLVVIHDFYDIPSSS